MRDFKKVREDLTNMLNPLFDYIQGGRKEYIRSIVTTLADNYNTKQFCRFLVNYALWNQPFNAQVTALAARWADQWDNESFLPNPIVGSSCLGARINSELICSVSDEVGLGDHSTIPHQELSFSFAKAVAEYSEIDFDVQVYWSGLGNYKLNTTKGYLDNIIIGLGYHIGSELNASGEFQVIHDVVSGRFKGLYHHLSEKKLYDRPLKHKPLIEWLSDHITVEIEHFNHALNAATYMLLGADSDTCFESRIDDLKQGIKLFHAHQGIYFDAYLYS